MFSLKGLVRRRKIFLLKNVKLTLSWYCSVLRKYHLIICSVCVCVCVCELTVQQQYTPAVVAHLVAPFLSSHCLPVRGRSAWTQLLYGLQIRKEEGLIFTDTSRIESKSTTVYLCRMTHFLRGAKHPVCGHYYIDLTLLF